MKISVYSLPNDENERARFTFTEVEKAYYVEKYSDHVDGQNERNRKARHYDRVKTIDGILENNKTCPEETLLQLGNIDGTVSADVLAQISAEYFEEFNKRYGSHVHILDWALHLDEATPHIHERHVFDAVNQYGELCPQQDKALEELGFELPKPNEKKGKYNNRKMVFDEECRKLFISICQKHGLDIDVEPVFGGASYLEKQDFIIMNQQKRIDEKQAVLDGLMMKIEDVNVVVVYFEKHYGLSNEKRIEDVIKVVANENRYHPVLDYINSLTWDGKERIRYALHHFLGAEVSDYTYEVMKLFMMGIISRISCPGIKFEVMLCLVGGQGAGKSTFLRFLAMKDDWFTDDLKKMDDDNVYRKIQAHLIVEFPEMVAILNAKNVEDTKSFMSRQKDTYKTPYDRHPKDHKRQCVFAGSSNSLDFLPMDRSGNRRFLPILCRSNEAEVHILDDEKASREYIDQMWAEAMVIYKSGDFQLKLPKKIEEELREYQKQFMQEDTKKELILDYLEHCQANMVCSRQLYAEALGNDGNPAQWEIREINDIMNNCSDWIAFSNPRHFPEPYRRQKGWEKPDNKENDFQPLTEEQMKQLSFFDE